MIILRSKIKHNNYVRIKYYCVNFNVDFIIITN